MEHTHIVSNIDLETYATSRDSEAVIPELIWILVNRSVSDLTTCRIPYGDSIGQSGWDGIVETESGFRQFVPSKRSFWEIGTGGGPQKKATSDFKKRTREMSEQQRKEAVYVFVTPHAGGAGGWTEPQQRRWLQRRKKFGWRDVKIIDGLQLQDWLREFPVVGRWLLKKMKVTKNLSGFTTPFEHWESLQQLPRGGDPPLPAKAFLVGRDQACVEISRLFRGEINQALLGLENESDAEDFLAAFLESQESQIANLFSSKCLFVTDEDAWHSMATLRTSHVLVAHPRLDLDSSGEALHLLASKNGHRVVIPVFGALVRGNGKIVQLRSPSASVLTSVLMEAGYSLERANELGSAGALSLAALKRHMRGLGDIAPYASWANARSLSHAGLLGRWFGENEADRSTAENLSGKTYGEWIETLRSDALRPNAPLTHRNEHWKIISRGEAWSALGPHLYNDDLDRFRATALAVLGEKDPRFELQPEERFSASILGKGLKHSADLRAGLAETLALLGSRSAALSSCSEGKAEGVAFSVVRELLKDQDWILWASLDPYLPLLAEAAPEAFLDSVEKAVLEPANSPFPSLFSQESSGITGGNYMTGLLWALETLAWHPDFLIRVTLVLGELAEIDPGGNWANRPENSLTDIFLPWHPQTCAEIQKRQVAVQTLLRESTTVGWKMILRLLPVMHGTTMGNRKPAWRDFIRPGWSDTVTHAEYWDQVSRYADLAVAAAAVDFTKLSELIDRLPDIPNPAHSRVLQHLVSSVVLDLPEKDRLQLWEALVDLSAKHRKFADAVWAMKPEAVTKIEDTAAKLVPKSPELIHRRLFSDREFLLLEDAEGYEESAKKLDEIRRDAVEEILTKVQIEGVIEFARQVASPWQVGNALGCTSQDVDGGLLPNYMNTNENSVRALVGGFVWGRFRTKGWQWVDALPLVVWSTEQVAIFLGFLPFQMGAWDRANQILRGNDAIYWRSVNVNPFGISIEELTVAVEKLLLNGRPNAAIACLAHLIEKKASFSQDLAIQALLAALSAEETKTSLDVYKIRQVISWLQKDPRTDPQTMRKIEWNYLRLLDSSHSKVGPIFLERQLATSASFFCEVIRATFRPDGAEADDKERTEEEKAIAQTCYLLLQHWRTAPGSVEDGSFDPGAFKTWLDEVRTLSVESGHFNIAMNQTGQVLPSVPPDPQGLWINQTVADALNAKDAARMRSGFTNKLINARGTYFLSRGEQERAIALRYRNQAESLDQAGYPRFAASMRELADFYDRQAQRDAEEEAL